MIKKTEGRDYLPEYKLGAIVKFANKTDFYTGSRHDRMIFSLGEIHSVLLKHLVCASMIARNKHSEGYSPVGEVVGVLLKKPNKPQGEAEFWEEGKRYTGIEFWSRNINWAQRVIATYHKNSGETLRRGNILQDLEMVTQRYGHCLLVKLYPIVRGSVRPTLAMARCEYVVDVWLKDRGEWGTTPDFDKETLPLIRDCWEELDI